MKPATGNNALYATNKVSIQQALDGHSFSVPKPERLSPEAERIEAEVLTPQTVLVPRELFEAASAAELLAAAGLACRENQEAVWSAPRSLGPETEAIAVMAVDTHILQAILERAGDRIVFTTPLLEGPTSGEPTLWLCRKAGVLYIKVFDRSLRMAEAIPVTNQADILYFIERIGHTFPLDEMQLHLTGEETALLRKLIGKRFKQVVCES